jgi:hypothetical protein
MSKRESSGWLPVAAAVIGMGVSVVSAAEPSYDQLKQQVQQLQDRVQNLEVQRPASGPAVDAMVARVLQDADRRSQLMSTEGFTAGYTADKGFVLQSADQSFLLHPYVLFQARHTTDWRDNQKADGNSDTQDGFEIRRLQVGFDGNALTPDLNYRFQWQTDRGNGSVSLQDAWARYRFADHWSVRAGQFKDPVFHEQLVGSGQQLTADRSLLNSILEGGDNYIQGASLIYDSLDRFRAEVALTDGFAGSNSNFQDPTDGIGDAGFAANNKKSYDWGAAGRAEYLLQGDPKKAWKQYNDFTALGNQDDLLVAGAGSDLSQSGDTSSWWHTVDLQYEP